MYGWANRRPLRPCRQQDDKGEELYPTKNSVRCSSSARREIVYQTHTRQAHHPHEANEVQIWGFLRLIADENKSSELQSIGSICEQGHEYDCVNSVGQEPVPAEMKGSLLLRGIRGGGFVNLGVQ